MCAPIRRDAVPTPDLKPKQVVPVPAPTAPSLASSAVAAAIASRACSGRTASARASESQPSKHSPTITFTVSRLRAAPGLCSSRWRSPPSHTGPTDSVFVSRIGLSIVPSSSSCVSPATLP